MAAAAAAQLGNLKEEATCSICLEYFTDPVMIIDCGHNFCRSCITQSWEGRDGNFPCPQCREISRRKSLRPNRQLGNMVDIAKQLHLPPVMPQGENLCEKHNQALLLFCAEDQRMICLVCRESKDHRNHVASPVEEAAKEHKLPENEWQEIQDDCWTSAVKGRGTFNWNDEDGAATPPFRSATSKGGSTSSSTDGVSLEVDGVERTRRSTEAKQEEVGEQTSPAEFYKPGGQRIHPSPRHGPEGGTWLNKLPENEWQEIQDDCWTSAVKGRGTFNWNDEDGAATPPFRSATSKGGSTSSSTDGVSLEVDGVERTRRSTEAKQEEVGEQTSPAEFYKPGGQRIHPSPRHGPEGGTWLNKVKLQGWLRLLKKEEKYFVESKVKDEEQYKTMREKLRTEKSKIESEFKKLLQLLKENEQTLHRRLEEMEKEITLVENANIAKLSNQITSLNALITEIEKKCEVPAWELLKDVRSTIIRCNNVKIQCPEVVKTNKVMVTLDPGTVHALLLLSEGRRRVRRTNTAQRLPDTPKRFTFWPCVLGSEGFTSGRHYWDVQLLQEGGAWQVGVAAESVNRKGRFTWSPEGGVWAVQRWKGQYKALTSPQTPLTPREKPLKLRVYLDYEAGRLSLYNAVSRELLYSFPQARFTQRLFPCFGLWDAAELRLV
ncbi:E3 ubiquitin-protein ligase TRIM39-like isoform X1 [Lissotriton helveticus]